MVKTPTGEGKVTDVQILTQLVVVQDAAGTREAFGLEDIEILAGNSAADQQKPKNADNIPVDDNSLVCRKRTTHSNSCTGDGTPVWHMFPSLDKQKTQHGSVSKECKQKISIVDDHGWVC